jgi:hypothetical protein
MSLYLDGKGRGIAYRNGPQERPEDGDKNHSPRHWRFLAFDNGKCPKYQSRVLQHTIISIV